MGRINNDVELRKQKFIEKSSNRHNNKYDYSKVEYIDGNTPVCIICPEHGEFWQAPISHTRGRGCPKCGNFNRGRFKRKTTEEFIEEAKKIHGDKYGYSKTKYLNADEKVIITCPKHGDFEIRPLSHLMGRGCPKCDNRNLSQEDVIEQFKEIHGDTYDYSMVKYTKKFDKVKIICKEHGIFEQTPVKHLLGQGCPKCAAINRSKERALTTEEYIEKCKKVWGDTYDYSKVKYVNAYTPVNIVCKKHGDFFQRAYDHTHGHGCPRCANIESDAEKEIYEFICSLVGEENVVRNNRSVLDGLEIDIYIPSKNIGFEYNGLVWHSEKYGKNSSYHLNKTIKAGEKGVTLIQIFEDEYMSKKEITLEKIRHILSADNNKKKIYGRKTSVKEIEKKDAENFLNQYHIQGYHPSTVAIGCFNGDELVGVMLFSKLQDKYVLTRFATNYNYICCGIGGKLFSYFVKKYNPAHIETFLDRRWAYNEESNLYTKLGFILTDEIKPTYWYVNNSSAKKRMHKFNFRKQTLSKKYDLPLTMTEKEMTEKLGFLRIWDCGLYKYTWSNNALC